MVVIATYKMIREHPVQSYVRGQCPVRREHSIFRSLSRKISAVPCRKLSHAQVDLRRLLFWPHTKSLLDLRSQGLQYRLLVLLDSNIFRIFFFTINVQTGRGYRQIWCEDNVELSIIFGFAHQRVALHGHQYGSHFSESASCFLCNSPHSSWSGMFGSQGATGWSCSQLQDYGVMSEGIICKRWAHMEKEADI